MPYVVSADGESWRWVEPKDVKVGDTTSNVTPTLPVKAPKFPVLEIGALQQLLRAKGIVSDQEIIDAARGDFP